MARKSSLKIELTVEFAPLPRERAAGFWAALGLPLEPFDWAASGPKQIQNESEENDGPRGPGTETEPVQL